MSKRTLKDFFTPPKQKKTENKITSPLQVKSDNEIKPEEKPVKNEDLNGDDVTPVKKAKLPNSMVEESKQKSSHKKRKNSPSTPQPKKRVRPRLSLAEDDDDEDPDLDVESDDSYDPGKNGIVSSDDDDDEASVVDEEELSDFSAPEMEEEPIVATPKSNRKRPAVKTTPTTPKTPKSTPSKAGSRALSLLSSFQFEPETPEAVDSSAVLYFHEKLDFLKPGSIVDGKKRRPDHPDYDETSVYVPSAFIKDQTPAMQQWWTLKSTNFNVVLFFKVGKFYELYHMDADVGVKELGLTYMRGAYAHCGFPEVAYGRYSSTLVQKGFIAARVEQTEKPAEQQKRIKGTPGLSKADKTLRREICQLSTIGTQQMSSFEGATFIDTNVYMMALMERNEHEFGVCLVDTLTGEFRLAQFKDDRNCSRLATILAHYIPAQVLLERRKHSIQLQKILSNGLSAVMKVALKPGSEFWDATKTIKTMKEEDYFGEDWPAQLKNMMSEEDVLCMTPHADYILAWSCLGACTYYLRHCLIDHQVIENGKFDWCDVSTMDATSSRQQQRQMPRNMIIDSVTLANLEILMNSDGSEDGALASCLDNCKTPFGKRLFRQWICAPLCRPCDINERLDAVEELLSNPQIDNDVIKVLRKLQDLERMVLRVHSMSKGCVPEDHPDMRAVMFEEKQYRKKTVNDFVSLLEQFDRVYLLLKRLEEEGRLERLKSSKLRSLLGIDGRTDGGKFPDIGPVMARWKKAFNYAKAKETGKIAPIPGTNPEYDDAVGDIADIQRRLDNYLEKQKKVLQCSNISYKGANNKRFQIEVPDKVNRKLIPSDYVVCGQRKNFRSFRTRETTDLLNSITDAECRRDKAQSETLTIVFREFKKDYSKWHNSVLCLSELDCLMSLAEFTRVSSCDGPTCRPKVLEPTDDNPILQLYDARHPSLNKKSLFSGGDFIPNDTILGGDKARSLLLTGPNMGGKSTLMRQVGLHVILAQIGCFVPAESFKFTACDRVFTRLGASDRIMSGESTFYVELSETCSILKHATRNSLVLLDELGRGTATYDGTAIASAVLETISSKLGARTIFSTHYHTLIDDFSKNPNVELGHMACMVDTENVTDTMTDSETHEKITFLYKLSDGACPKSYGFHAAMLAGIPNDIVSLAREKAEKMEKRCKKMKLFRALMTSEDPVDCQHLFASLKIK